MLLSILLGLSLGFSFRTAYLPLAPPRGGAPPGSRHDGRVFNAPDRHGHLSSSLCRTLQCPVLEFRCQPCNTAPARTASGGYAIWLHHRYAWRLFLVARCQSLAWKLERGVAFWTPLQTLYGRDPALPELPLTRDSFRQSRPANRRARPPGSREPRVGVNTTYRRWSRVARAEQMKRRHREYPWRNSSASCKHRIDPS